MEIKPQAQHFNSRRRTIAKQSKKKKNETGMDQPTPYVGNAEKYNEENVVSSEITCMPSKRTAYI